MDTVPGQLSAASRSDSSPGFDVAVVGGGAAGLHAALETAGLGARVALIARKPLAESSSYWAQGGLAAAIAPDDSPDRHAEDTLNAGRGLCRPEAVRALAEEAPAAVEKLIARGVRFDRDDGQLSLALEGGHSARRIVHAGGAATGREITRRLAALVAAEELITLFEGRSVQALIGADGRCLGAHTDAGPIAAAATILATGGGAALWERTTNPWGAIGAGSVLAHRIGARLGGLELCQFHPTALSAPGTALDGRLISEAVRGEGALLRDASGRRFTDELAPRDQVTAAILDRMAADGTGSVQLDLSPVDLDRFPSIATMLTDAGLASETAVPVAPAAHYLIGGIATDLDGSSGVEGLFAVGECAYTGIHGANRLASNSLSECFVFGTRAAEAAASLAEDALPPGSARDDGWRFRPPTAETRARLWRLAGPQRDGTELAELADDPYPLARQIARSALARAESRGAHRRLDHPARDPGLDGLHTWVEADDEVRLEGGSRFRAS